MPKETNDYTQCKRGYHPLIEIDSQPIKKSRTKVVRWCPMCGAIVVDQDADGKTIPGHYRKMSYPEMTRKLGFD